jgi:enterochelin esterase-like enzyme
VGVRDALLILAVVALTGCGGSAPAARILPGSFSVVSRGPGGGTMWEGTIPHPGVHDALRPAVVYLPPHVSRSRRYDVVYLLHGFRGSPLGYVNGLRFASIADREIASGRVPPFIAVIPAAGPTVRYDGEWVGRWERLVVRDDLPWVDAHLPVRRGPAHRAIGGDSAGGYGAVDIGLRHPGLFGVLESWSGYFTPIADGPLTDAPPALLRAHDPELLAEREAPALRRLGTRFYLSCGTHDRAALRATRRFARELARLGIRHGVVVRDGDHGGRFWRAQLPAALAYALRR